MNVRQTSLVAYCDLLADGSLAGQKALIYDTLCKFEGGLTRQQIASVAGLPINSVCGRAKELLDQGFLFEDGTRIGNSGKSNLVLKCATFHLKKKI